MGGDIKRQHVLNIHLTCDMSEVMNQGKRNEEDNVAVQLGHCRVSVHQIITPGNTQGDITQECLRWQSYII